MKKVALVLVPVIILLSIIGLILFAYLKGPANTPVDPTYNSDTEYQETPDDTDPTYSDQSQDSTSSTENDTNQETTNPDEIITPSEPIEQDPDNTKPDNQQGQNESKPNKDETNPAKPEETVMKIAGSEIKISGKSSPTDVFEQLNMEYQMIPNTESLIKVNTYRSLEKDDMKYGVISTLEFDVDNKTKFCGITIMLKDAEDESISLLNVNKNTTFDELVDVFGEAKKIEEYGLDNMYTQTTTVGGEKLLLVTTIDPETNCVESITATFW